MPAHSPAGTGSRLAVSLTQPAGGRFAEAVGGVACGVLAQEASRTEIRAPAIKRLVIVITSSIIVGLPVQPRKRAACQSACAKVPGACTMRGLLKGLLRQVVRTIA